MRACVHGFDGLSPPSLSLCVFGVGATYLVVRGDDAEFDCADVGIAIDRSGNTPDEALAVYLAERGGDLDNWVLVHQDADSATYEPDNASVSLGFRSIIVAMRPAGV